MPTLVGVFSQPLQVAEVAEKLRDRGYSEMEIYSPVPSGELDHVLDKKPSRVRYYTLIGGLAGVVTGYVMTVLMAEDWPLIVGGKPVASFAPYTVIAFELTILFGVIMTVLGVFVVGGLPHGKFGSNDVGYDARFSAEDFGLVVRCKDRDVSEIDAMLRAGKALEVTLVEG
ncbi:hypothetical protein MYXO_03847 [Myxococcaceae bacterium]|jgi:hypothetical protein|nr:hypothetical protein MYXO_03847 [Myxococcaceae bacterium]